MRRVCVCSAPHTCVTGLVEPIKSGRQLIWGKSLPTRATAAVRSAADLQSSCAQPSPCEPIPLTPHTWARNGECNITSRGGGRRVAGGRWGREVEVGMGVGRREGRGGGCRRGGGGRRGAIHMFRSELGQ